MADKTETAANVPAVKPEQITLALAAIIEGKELPAALKGGEAHSAILERIASATTLEELFAQRKLESWRELENVPVTVQGFHLNPSSFEEGPTVYAVVEVVTMDDGEAITVASGARNVMVQLVKAWEFGQIPGLRCRYISQRTGEGYAAGWLELVE